MLTLETCSYVPATLRAVTVTVAMFQVRLGLEPFFNWSCIELRSNAKLPVDRFLRDAEVDEVEKALSIDSIQELLGELGLAFFRIKFGQIHGWN